MNESFQLDDEVVALCQPGLGSRPGVGSIEVWAEIDLESLAGRSSLGSGLAKVTSRLLDQLATGTVTTAHRGVPTASEPQRDARGNRVPPDDSRLVAWKRVVAVSGAGSLLALVSLPLPA